MPKKRVRLDKKKIVKHISYSYGKKEVSYKIPAGIKMLIFYVSILFLFYLAYLLISIKSPMAFAFGRIIGGIPALIINLILIIGSALIIYGLIKRKRWSYYLCFVWFSFGILNSFISLALTKAGMLDVTRNLMALSSFTVLVINAITLWYLVSERTYFIAHIFPYKKSRIVDKIYITIMIIFLIATFSISIALGYDFYRSNKELAKNLINELNKKSGDEQIQICSSKSGTEKDICFIIVSIMQQNPLLCDNIKSDFYRFSCLRA